MHPLQLKPYAKLVSQVCARWRSIVHWRSHGRELYHAAISLNYSESDRSASHVEIFPILKAYLDGINDSEDAELDVEWRFSRDVRVRHAAPVAVEHDMLVRLFLHGMNLTARHFNRVRSLKANISDPKIGDFCLFLLNSLGDVPAFTHLYISSLTDYPSRERGERPPLIPTCAPFDGPFRVGMFLPLAPYTALSDLTLVMDFKDLDIFVLPAGLLHLYLIYQNHRGSDTRFDLWAVILQCGSLRTLAIEYVGFDSLPDDRSSDIAIDLPCLTKLTISNVILGDLLALLPLLKTPILKHLCFYRLQERGYVDPETVNDNSCSENSADSQSQAVRDFVAPQRLLVHLERFPNVYNIISDLLSCMTLDQLELVQIEGEDDFRSLSSNPDYTPRIAGQAVFDIIRYDSRTANRYSLPEVRVVSLDGLLLYASLEDAELRPQIH